MITFNKASHCRVKIEPTYVMKIYISGARSTMLYKVKRIVWGNMKWDFWEKPKNYGMRNVCCENEETENRRAIWWGEVGIQGNVCSYDTWQRSNIIFEGYCSDLFYR